MTQHIDIDAVEKRIELPCGASLVLLDRLAKESIYGQIECARNIYLVDAGANIIWQVQTDFDFDAGSFTNIIFDGNEIKGYRWDGGVYGINLKNGKGIPALLMK